MASWRGLAAMLKSSFLGQVGQGGSAFYRPFVFVTLFADYRPLGPQPLVFHAANIAWHAACAVLVYLLLNRLFQRRSLSLIGGLVFAVHPVHSESVAWISGRTDVVCGAFMLLALLMHVKHRESADVRHLAVAVAGALLAMFSKELAVALPLLAALSDRIVLPGRQLDKRELFRPYVFYVAAVALYLAARFASLGSVEAASTATAFEAAPFAARLLGLPVNLFRYVLVLLWPSYSKPFYSYWTAERVTAPLAVAWVCLALLVFAVVRLRRSRPEVFFAAVWFGLTILPACNLVQLSGTTMAERFLYVPSVGYAALVGWVGASLLSWRPLGFAAKQAAVAALLVAYLGLCVVWTVRSNVIWRSNLTLFTRMAKVAPDQTFVHNELGGAYLAEGLASSAIEHFQEAIRLKPDYGAAYANLGSAFRDSGDLVAAERAYRKAVELFPSNPDAYNGLGGILAQGGRLNEAIAVMRRGVSAAPNVAVLRANLGRAYLADGQAARAAEELEMACKLEPANLESWLYLAKSYERAGRSAEAREIYLKLKDAPQPEIASEAEGGLMRILGAD